MPRKAKSDSSVRLNGNIRQALGESKNNRKNQPLGEKLEARLNALAAAYPAELKSPTREKFFTSYLNPLSDILQNINVCIAYLDSKGNYLHVNPAFAKTLGQEPEFFIGKNGFELNPSEEGRLLFESVLKTGQPAADFDIPVQDPTKPDRGTTYWDWSLQPIREETGQVSGIIFTSTEVTERKRAKKALEENRALSELLFESAPDANVLVDEKGKILSMNRQAETMFGYQRTELIGDHIEILVPERDCEGHIKHRADYMNNPHLREMGNGQELFARRRDGSEFPVTVTLSPLKTENGTLVLSVVRDISHLKEAEQSLRVSEARFHAIFDNAAVGIQLLSKDGRLLETNPAMQSMLGYTAEELRGMSFLEFTHEEDAPRNVPLFEALVEQKIISYRLEKRYKRKDGHIFWGRLNVSRFMERPEDPPYVIVTVEDISELKTAGQALLQSEERFRKSVETLLDGFAILSSIRDATNEIIDFRFEYINEAGSRLNQRSREEILGNTLLEILPGHLQTTLFDNYVRLVKTGEPLLLESQSYEDPYGGKQILRFFDIKAVRLGDGLAVTWEDVTERKQIEAELAEVQRKLLTKDEEERLYLARELHDGPIQELYGLSFQISELRQRLGEEADRELAGKAMQTLQQAIIDLRSMMSELRPPSLAPFGLEKTIRSHAQSFREQHPEMTLHLTLAQDGQKLPELVRLALFRIYQEALNNILRHAGAHNIFVEFQIENDSARISIQDDGVGFEVPRHWVYLARKGHYGLVGMRERAEALGGKFELTSTPGKGTLYHAVVPLVGQTVS